VIVRAPTLLATRLAALLLVACRGGGSAPAGVGSAVGSALPAAHAAAERTPWRCAAGDAEALPDEALAIGARRWRLGGHTLTLPPAAAAGVVIGVVADGGGPQPATAAALRGLRDALGAADVVIALGGMAGDQAGLEATLGALAEGAPWPVVALPGDLEAVPALTAATAALRARGVLALDGRRLRWLRGDGVAVATLPGVAAPSELVAGEGGCVYLAEDLPPLLAELGRAPGLRVLAAATAPRAADATTATGDLTLGRALAAVSVDLVLAPGPAATPDVSGDRDGGRRLLSPGPCDATPRLAGPPAPRAGLLTLRDGRWRWTTVAPR
jgi:hypothetical protein